MGLNLADPMQQLWVSTLLTFSAKGQCVEQHPVSTVISRYCEVQFSCPAGLIGNTRYSGGACSSQPSVAQVSKLSSV